MPLLIHAVRRALALYSQAVELARQAHREVRDVDHLLDLAQSLGQHLAHFEADQHAEIVLVPAQFVADLADDYAALRSRVCAPAQERFGSAPHNLFVIVGARHPHFGDFRTVARIDGNQFAAPGLLDPLAPSGAGIDFSDAQAFERFLNPGGFSDFHDRLRL